MWKPGFPIDCGSGLSGNSGDCLRSLVEICGRNVALRAREIGSNVALLVVHNSEILDRDISNIHE
jgi:hypothetical protein